MMFSLPGETQLIPRRGEGTQVTRVLVSFSGEFGTPPFVLTSRASPASHRLLFCETLISVVGNVLTDGNAKVPRPDAHLFVEWIRVYKPSPLLEEHRINRPLRHIEHLEHAKENSQVIKEEEMHSVY